MAKALAFDLITRDKTFSRGLDQAGKKASGFQKAMGRVSVGLAGAFAGGAIIAAVKKVADAGSDLNETVNKLGLAFGKNAGAIQAWAQGSAKSMGLPKQAALDGAATFGLLFSKIGVGAGQSAKMSQAMVQLAVDLGSVHNADPTEIIEAQTAAFRGEYDSLQKFVPAINAAAVETEALRQTGKENVKQLTDAEKAQAVYSIMLKQTTKEQGDFARTANESANKTKINAARMKDLQANIGTVLLPALTKLTNALGDMATWIERNKTAATVLGGAIVAVAGFVLAMSAATKVSMAVQAAAKGATLAWAAAQWLLNAALTANPIGLVVAAVALLVAGIVIAYKRSETFRTVVGKVFDFVRDKVGAVVSTIIDILRGWLNFQFSVVEGILRVMGKLPGPMGAPFRKAEEAVKKAKETVNTQLAKIQDRVNKLRGKDIPISASLKLNFTKSFTAKDWVAVRVAAGRMATGGPVGGRGPGGRDTELRWLDPTEHVWTGAEVAAAGGHRAMERWRKAVLAGQVPGMQAGGPVGRIDTKTREINRIQARGTAARMDKGLTKLADRFAGALGGLSGPGGWRWQMAALRSAFPGLALISGFRPGAITATGNRSYHALGRAVDVPPRMDVFNWIRAMYGARTKELIFTPAGRRQVWNGRPHVYSGVTARNHWDHVHWAYHKGGRLPEDVFGRGRSGRSYSFQGGETVSPRDGGIRLHPDSIRALAAELRNNPPTVAVADLDAGVRRYQRNRGRPQVGFG